MTYYYLGASLPLLLFDAPPSMPPEGFLSLVREHCSGSDHAMVAAATTTPMPDTHSSNATLERYYSWERCLRRSLVELRARRLGIE